METVLFVAVALLGSFVQTSCGLGFAVMKSFCDSVRVTSTPGKGTSVTLTKRFETRG